MTIRVVIIDDSATMRAILRARLAREGDIEVVGSAANAVEGRAAIKLYNPDVVTLDIEMPGMNGLEFLSKIMALRPTPVIVVSGLTSAGNAITAQALAHGAVDCYAKGDRSGQLLLDDNGKLASLVRQAARVRYDAGTPSTMPDPAPIARAIGKPASLIAIGSSTGGVEALQTVLGGFPADCPPTVIVQHVNARFAAAIVRTLDQACPATVQLADADVPLRRGNVYLAPGGDRHLLVSGSGPYFAKLRSGDQISGHRPSVDALFGSVARMAGGDAIGILLTGMGSDGARGLLAMAQAGAVTIAQDEMTSTVFGMPKAAIALNAAQIIAPIGEIAGHVIQQAA